MNDGTQMITEKSEKKIIICDRMNMTMLDEYIKALLKERNNLDYQ